MSYLHLGNEYGTFIIDKNEKIIRRSKNLRGIIDYARVSKVVKLESKKTPDNYYRGLLKVFFDDGCYSIANFACYHIMIDWVRNRRIFKNAHHVMHDENMGYLTYPGELNNEA